jgi:riboflavin synthase
MFTGLVTDIGEVLAVESCADGPRRLTVSCSYPSEEIGIGSSIACNGVCLSVVARGKRGERSWFAVDAAAETLRITSIAAWVVGRRINLERALRVGDELGGHLMTGHVDGLAEVIAREEATGTARLTLRPPAALGRFITSKASVSLDGVSLTVNEFAGDTFSVLIIPHTLAATTLNDLAVGDAANLEVDMIARYTARMLEQMRLPTT